MRSAVFFGLALISFVLLDKATWAQGAVKATVNIDGIVTSIPGKPIKEIDVAVYRQGHQVVATETDMTGNYSLQVLSGEPVEVFYSSRGEDWAPILIGPISGSANGKINVTLQELNEARSYQAALEVLNIYKKIYDLETHVPPSVEKEERMARYQESLRTLQVPIEASQQASEIWSLYKRHDIPQNLLTPPKDLIPDQAKSGYWDLGDDGKP
jgi:hypothetical protein